MPEILITHPTMGTTAPVQWTVGTDAGEVAAVKDRFGWCFYLLPQQELIGLIAKLPSCNGMTTELHAMPWKRELPKGTRLTNTNVTMLAVEVGNKHAELNRDGQWALYVIEREARRCGIDLSEDANDGS